MNTKGIMAMRLYILIHTIECRAETRNWECKDTEELLDRLRSRVTEYYL